MKKNLLILAFVLVGISFVQAKVLEVKHKVSFGILGQMGVAEEKLVTQGNIYIIETKMKATGLAKTLSKNREEKHLSKGHIVNGMYVSDTYSVRKSYGKIKVEKTYYIDHKEKKVTKEYQKFENGKSVSKEKSTLDFYSQNDLLTLYFNLPIMIQDKNKAGNYGFSAVGAERQKGLVEVMLPKNEELKKYKDTLGEGEYWYMTAIIHQKIFASNKGELMLAIDKDGIAQKVVLKDLAMFGDLSAERIKF